MNTKINPLREILVVGGSGFLGSNLINYLSNFSVTLLGRSCKNKSLDKKNIEYINLDINNFENVSFFLQSRKFSCVLYLAWADSCHHDSIENLSFSVSSMNFLKCFLQYNPESRVIISGSIHETGIESGLVRNNFIGMNPKNLYGLSKKNLWDFLSIIKARNVAWIRLSNVYGKGDHKNKVLSKIVNSVKSKKPFILNNENSFIDFINVKDVCEALISVLDSTVEGVINLGSGKGYFIKDIIFFIENYIYTGIYSNIKFYEFSSFGPILDLSKINIVLNFYPKISIESDLVDFIKNIK